MMEGHKWDLFILDLSFFFWHILGALLFGIGEFWVGAYQLTAHAVFYEELKSANVIVR